MYMFQHGHGIKNIGSFKMCDVQELWRCNCIKHMGLRQQRFLLDVWCSRIVKMQPMATYYGIYRFYTRQSRPIWLG
jgi:hypothetical protein